MEIRGCKGSKLQALNRLAVKHAIRDEQEKLFHFRLHAFRHTKAVELINNGMSLVLVQQWMAHASPEMTLIYARMLDETMHSQWEKTVQHGIVQFNEGRPVYVPGKKMLTVRNSPQTFDPERVRDYRHNTKLPVGNQAGNAYWILVNQKNLDERIRPAIAMLRQGQTVAKSEKYEREYTLEEWEQRQVRRENTREENT